MRGSTAYTRVQNETASRERLLVLLLQAACRHLDTAARALEAGRRAEAAAPLGRCMDIITELLATLDSAAAPELCRQLADVYQFTLHRITLALASGNATAAREALRVVQPVADAFEQVTNAPAAAEAR
ncbi:MAG: flagellar protein FliS [Deltaproteobacteria bacterium]|nr:flagellar protein FliS [Deltaproteobacteria bacterium]